MIKYLDYYITFQEVPNEIALTFTITNCPHRCPGCHSPWLRNDDGKSLLEDLETIMNRYKDDITCVCLMGEGNDTEELWHALAQVKASGLKTCLYSGCEQAASWYFLKTYRGLLDYLKLGPYDETFGPLDVTTTNQVMFKVENDNLYNITDWFWRKKV